MPLPAPMGSHRYDDAFWKSLRKGNYRRLKEENIKKFRLPRRKIAEFCKRWSVTEFSVFGSVLRADFTPESDIDVLVSIDPGAQIGLFELTAMKTELEALLQRPVDLVEKEGIRNPYRRREILKTAQVIYASG